MSRARCSRVCCPPPLVRHHSLPVHHHVSLRDLVLPLLHHQHHGWRRESRVVGYTVDTHRKSVYMGYVSTSTGRKLVALRRLTPCAVSVSVHAIVTHASSALLCPVTESSGRVINRTILSAALNRAVSIVRSRRQP